MRRIIVLLSALILFVGCSSTVNLNFMERPLAACDYPAALTALQAHADELQSAQGIIIRNLDLGMMSHFARDYDLSNQYLGQAELKISDAYTKSFTKEAASGFLGDNAKDYPGEDFEDIYTNVFKALNYQSMGKTQDAMVEIRRLSEKQQVLKDKYQKLLSATNQSASANGVGNVQTNLVSVEFSQSALASYLGMLFARQLNDTNDMKYYHRQIGEAFQTQPNIYPFAVPSSIDEELSVPEGKARVNFVAFSGKEPVKQENVQTIFITPEQWMKLSFPEMVSRSPEVVKVKAKIGDQEIVLEPMESIQAIAINTFSLRKESIYNSTVIRATLKAVGTSIIGAASHAALDDKHKRSALADLITLFSSAVNDATENADLRMSHFFPGQARIGGMTVDPGVYDVEIGFYNAAGKKIGEVIYQQMDIKSGALILCEGACLR